MSGPSHYETLGIDPAATSAEIRAAFERLESVFDASSLAVYALVGGDAREDELRRIREAFRVLGDPDARAGYDAERGFAPPEIELTDEDIVSSTPLAQEPAATHLADEPAVVAPASGPDATAADGIASHPSAPVPVEVEVAGAAEDVELDLDGETAGDDAGLPPIDENTEFTGALLRALREARGLTLKDIAGRTRIGTGHLQHIEEEAFDRLPERVFLRGFLLSYARELKLDAGRVADTYLRRRGG